MKKTAQYDPYDDDPYESQLGLAPGLPAEVEQQYYQPTPSTGSTPGAPRWLLPAALAASGVLGWKLLKRFRGGAKNLEQAGKAVSGAGQAQSVPASLRMDPLEFDAMARSDMMSSLYPGSAVGARAGQHAEQYFKQFPHMREQILRGLGDAAKGK